MFFWFFCGVVVQLHIFYTQLNFICFFKIFLLTVRRGWLEFNSKFQVSKVKKVRVFFCNQTGCRTKKNTNQWDYCYRQIFQFVYKIEHIEPSFRMRTKHMFVVNYNMMKHIKKNENILARTVILIKIPSFLRNKIPYKKKKKIGTKLVLLHVENIVP